MENQFYGKENRAGYYKKNLNGELAFRSFVPKDLQDIQIQYTDHLVSLLGKAWRAIGAFTDRWSLLSKETQEESIRRIIHQEAEESVRLSVDSADPSENRQLDTFGAGGIMNLQKEILQFDPDKLSEAEKEKPLKGNAADDAKWLEDANFYALKRMKKLPLSLRLVCELHDYAMHAFHNYDNKPGEFRYSPLWIGRPGSTLKNAAFVPPVPDDMKRGLYQLENYMHEENGPDPLIRAALIHYQFEMLHPFLDGNGRVGRLLTMLYLYDQQVLPAPVLAFSRVLRRKEFHYYLTFPFVEEDGDYERMIEFWLSVIAESCEKEMDLLRKH